MNPCRAVGLPPHPDAAMVRRRQASRCHGRMQAGERFQVVDIFDEVEEDLRAERAEKLLKKYAWLLIVAAVAVVGAAAGWQLWSRYQNQRDAAAAARYVAVQNALEQPAAQPG